MESKILKVGARAVLLLVLVGAPALAAGGCGGGTPATPAGGANAVPPPPIPTSNEIAYVSASAGGTLDVVRTDGTPSPAKVPLGSVQPYFAPVDWSRGGLIAFTAKNGIYSVRSDGTNLKQVTFAGGNNPPPGSATKLDVGPRWSPNGQKLAFVRATTLATTHRDVAAANADGSGFALLTQAPGDNFDPSWSRDSTRIAFTSTRDGNPELYVVGADGTGLQRLTSNSIADTHPVWSPTNASVIAFVQDGDIHTVQADGTGDSQLTHGAKIFDAPSWSADGSTLVYVSDRASATGDLYAIQSDGTRERRVSNDSQWDAKPVVAPDGTRVVDVRGFADAKDLYVFSTTTPARLPRIGGRRLTQDSAEDNYPVWRPPASLQPH